MSLPSTRHSLFSRMRRGDDGAWTDYAARYSGPALGFLRSLGISCEDAEDILQETLLKLSQYDRRGGTRFRSWLMTVLRHSVCGLQKHRRARMRDVRLTFSLDGAFANSEEGNALLERLEDETARHFASSAKAVQESLDRMLKEYRDADRRLYLEWFWKDDETDEDIAARLGVNKARLRYVREKVEAHLHKRAAREMEI